MSAFMWDPKSDLETPAVYLRRVLGELAEGTKEEDRLVIREIGKRAEMDNLANTVCRPLGDLARGTNRALRVKIRVLNDAITRGEFSPGPEDPDGMERRMSRMKSGAGLG